MVNLIKMDYELKHGKLFPVFLCEIDFNSANYKRVVQQARDKSLHTMSAGQDGISRDSNTKFERQLMGMIAEVACLEYLSQIITEFNLINFKAERYDDIRTDGFKSPQNEFDLRIRNTSNDKTIHIESRSSITHNIPFVDGILKYDILGQYSSIAKSGESSNDLYLRPLYEYIDFKNGDYYKKSFSQLLESRKIFLYLVAGCKFEDFKTKGGVKSMGQYGSRFNYVPIISGTDILNFKSVVVDTLKKNTL